MNRMIKIWLMSGVAAVVLVLIVIPKKTASFDTRMTVASTFFAAVAAVAGVLALWYASRTVRDAETASQEARDQHREQIEALNTATASQVSELRRATEESAEQHRVEMAGRRALDEAEKFEKRVRQIADLINLVVEVGNVARDVARNYNAEAGAMTAAYASIPSMVIAVDGRLAVLSALGFEPPPKTVEFVRIAGYAGVTASEVATRSVDALLELQGLAAEVTDVRMGEIVKAKSSNPSPLRK